MWKLYEDPGDFIPYVFHAVIIGMRRSLPADVISCFSPNTPMVLADNASSLAKQFDSQTDQLHSRSLQLP